MDLLTLTVQIVALAGCALCVFACMRHASDAHDEANQLRNARARVIALEHQLDALGAGLNKLRGKFYATLQHEPPDKDEHAAYVTTTATPCENWSQAQLLGPRSPAATCECAYCTEMRAQRAAQKAAILRLHEKGAPRPRANGSE